MLNVTMKDAMKKVDTGTNHLIFISQHYLIPNSTTVNKDHRFTVMTKPSAIMNMVSGTIEQRNLILTINIILIIFSNNTKLELILSFVIVKDIVTTKQDIGIQMVILIPISTSIKMDTILIRRYLPMANIFASIRRYIYLIV